MAGKGQADPSAAGRLSAVLALVAGGVYAVSLLSISLATTTAYALALAAPVFLSMLIPFAAGALALWRPQTGILAAAWGWVLGVHVPSALNHFAAGLQPVPPVLVRALRAGGLWIEGPDYFSLGLIALALTGLALCIADEYAQSSDRRV